MEYYRRQKFVPKKQRRRQDMAFIAAVLSFIAAWGGGVYKLAKISPSSEITTEAVQQLEQNQTEDTIKITEHVPLVREDGSELILLGTSRNNNFVFNPGYLTSDETGVYFDDVISNLQQSLDDGDNIYIYVINTEEYEIYTPILNWMCNSANVFHDNPDITITSYDCFEFSEKFVLTGGLVSVDTLKNFASECGNVCQFNKWRIKELLYMQYGDSFYEWDTFYSQRKSGESYTLKK